MPQTTLDVFAGLRATETIRRGGAVAYRLSGTRMSGTIVFLPDVRDDQAVPDRVAVRFGDGDHPLATHLHDLPAVGDVTLIGGGDRIVLDEPGWTSRLALAPRDPATCPAPRSTPAIAYAKQVCQRLADRYRQLDRDALMLAAASRTANRRLARWVHRQVLPDLAMAAECQEELAGAWPLAEQLQQLSPLRLLPAGRSGCACRGTSTCLDPDTYLSRTPGGYWLTCPRCHEGTIRITDGTPLVRLLAGHAEHACPATSN